jgi:type IX secretion system PorP/SprF family membrane protein
MKQFILSITILGSFLQGNTQGIHFSQYYNAPMLINPANTGFLQDNEWRTGLNYRSQWATVPVPYNTFSMFGDVALFRERLETSWLGLGVAAWRDVAGNGSLALTKFQSNLAYHILLGEKSSLSAGLSAAYNQRSVDFSKLTFDAQWDEFSFNGALPSLETNLNQKTSYVDIGAGMGLSFYNNNNLFVKVGVAARNMNQPVESFYGANNKIGIRPIANLDVVYKPSEKFIINPSVYFTRQKRASELVAGSMFNINVGENNVAGNNEFLIGAFYRNKDAAIFATGYKFRQNKFTVSYDHTVSDLSSANGGIGAFEISLILMGTFQKGTEMTNTYGCPRF